MSITKVITLPDYLKIKLEKIFAGEAEIFSDADVGLLNHYFKEQETEQATKFFREFRCLLNPKRHGVQDAYIGSLFKFE